MPTRTDAAYRLASSHLRAYPVHLSPGLSRVALVPEQAVLLAGDRVSLEVRVGRGHRLELVEPGGTVAYAMHGEPAHWDVTVDVEDGGSLVWHGEPFVIAEHAHVTRTLAVRLGYDAGLVLRETLVLGRHGEGPGSLASRTRVDRGGRPVLVEDLDLGPEALAPGLLGRGRVVDQLLDLRPGVAPDPTALRLEAGGNLHRRLVAQAHESDLGRLWDRLAEPQSSPE